MEAPALLFALRRAVWHAAGLAALAILLPAPSAWGQPSCDGGSLLDQARCLQQGAQANPQGVVPSYHGASVPQAQYFNERGDTSALTRDAQAASETSELYRTITGPVRDAISQWNVLNDPAVRAAQSLAIDWSGQAATQQTCMEQAMCVESQPGSPIHATCEQPGVSRATCQITEDATVSHAVLASGSTDWMGVGGIEDAVWVRLRKVQDGLYAVEVANANNRNDCGDGNVLGTQWTFTLDLRDQLPAATLGTMMTVDVAAQGGGCGWNTRTFNDATTEYCRVLNCDAGGMQWPAIQVTYRLEGDVRQTQLADGCEPYRTDGALQRDACLHDGALPRSCELGHAYSLLPTSGCWTREQEWVFPTPGPDACEPYRSNPACAQTALTCVDPNTETGECRRWQATYQCAGEPVCARTQTVRHCRACGAPGSLVPFCTDTPGPSQQNVNDLFLTATYLELLKQAKQDFDPDTLRIFTGHRMACDYNPVSTTVQDCCADDPDQLFGSCSDEAKQLALDKRAKKAHYVGTRCVEWTSFLVGRICTRKEQVWCSQNSQLARLVQEQGRAQMGRDWGTADQPDCRGFTLDELQALRFADMDFSEWFTNVRASVNAEAIMTQMRDQIQAYQHQYGSSEGSP